MIETNRLQIRLPEGVEFSLRLAGPITRFFAWFIDMACIAAAASLLSTLLAFFRTFSDDIGGALFYISYFVLTLGYSILLEWAWRGQTIGKRVLRLRVMDASGMRLKFGQVLLRNLIRFVDMMPALYCLGGAVCLFSRKSQRLGDLAANTIVVRQVEAPQPELEKLMEGKFNSLRAHAHLAARLRQKVEPRQASLMLQALLRRDQLEPGSRIKIFAQAAAELRALVPFPEEIAETLSDEAQVRNVVDLIYRPRLRNEAGKSSEPAAN